MKDGCNSKVPSRVSGHSKTQKRPDSVIVEGRYEHSGGTASSKNISPSPFIQFVIYVVYVTVCIKEASNKKDERKEKQLQVAHSILLQVAFKIEAKMSPCTCYKLYHRSKEKESTVEG